MRKLWSKEEEQYLSEMWGCISIGSIAKKLGRSHNAIKIKAQCLNLGSFLESGDYVTFSQLLVAIGVTNCDVYKKTSWIKKRNFPIKYKKVENKKFKVVYIPDFWKWAEENKNIIDFSKIPKGIFGKEPDFVKKLRQQDFYNIDKKKTRRWTKQEEDKLKHLLNEYKYSYLEISEKLGRTSGAILHRCDVLGIKARPVREICKKWQKEEIEKLFEMIKDGCGYNQMAKVLERSDTAIRGKVYNTFRTKNLDKVIIKMKSEKEKC